MFTTRTATGLTIALLALPATATAQGGGGGGGGGGGEGGGGGPATSNPLPYGAAGVVVEPNPDQRAYAPTSSLAGTTAQDLRSPDAADAARAGEVAKAMEHYQRSQPLPAAARPAAPPASGYQLASHDDNAPAWPEIAFAGVVLLATAGGVMRVRLRRSRRVAA